MKFPLSGHADVAAGDAEMFSYRRGRGDGFTSERPENVNGRVQTALIPKRLISEELRAHADLLPLSILLYSD